MDWAHDVREADLDFQGCWCVLGTVAYSGSMGTTLLFPYRGHAVFTQTLSFPPIVYQGNKLFIANITKRTASAYTY